MRLIDADAIHYCSYDLDNYHSFSAVTDDDIAEMPTLDAVEVVRCKDCKWFTNAHIDRGVCEMERDACGTSAVWYINDYCSYGERKDDEKQTD